MISHLPVVPQKVGGSKLEEASFFFRLPALNENPADYSTLKSLEMRSKRVYKICICSVIQGELEAFRNYKGFSFIFLKV